MNQIDVQNPPPYAGFWIRTLAYVIDAIALGLVTMPLVAFLTKLGVGDEQGNLLSIVISWMYFAVFESSDWQGTPGKKVLGLVVTDEQGQKISVIRATKRYAAKMLAAFLLGAGLIMIAFTARKQGLHDKLFHTLVFKARR